MYSLSTSEDDFTREKKLREPRWVATLTDGTEVFQDDDRPGENPGQAWQRLKLWMSSQGWVKLKSLRLEWRGDKIASLPDGAPGYFFRKSILSEVGGGASQGFYILGHVENGRLKTQRWAVPQMMKLDESWRSLEEASDSLIMN